MQQHGKPDQVQHYRSIGFNFPLCLEYMSAFHTKDWAKREPLLSVYDSLYELYKPLIDKAKKEHRW